MINLILFGLPGAGKGTQAGRLEEKYNLKHISTGDVFRYNIKNETPLGKTAKKYIDDGQLVPDEVTINMLHSEVEKNKGSRGFIFDGFPRTTAQAKDLDDLLQKKGSKVHAMLMLKVDEDILVKRLLERGKTSGRVDDANEDIIRKRMQVYYDQSEVVKEYYKKSDKYFEVDGVGSLDEVTARLNDIINEVEEQ